MFLFTTLFLGFLFRGLITGSEILVNGQTVEIYHSYIAGCILLGIALCTATVLMWSYLAKGNNALTLIMTAINSLSMLVLYVPLGRFLLGLKWIAVPLFIQTIFIFILGYFLARLLRFSYRDAVPTAMIGASNHFEVSIATATTLFGLGAGAALATVVGVLIEVPTMLMPVSICKKTGYLFEKCHLNLPQCKYRDTAIKIERV